MLKRRSIVSTKFVLNTAIIYSVIIVLIVVSFFYILKVNSNILHEIVLKSNDAYYVKKAELVVDRLKEKKIKNLKELSENLKGYCGADNDFLYILLYSKTSDENFFKIRKKIPLNPSLKITAEINKEIHENKEINYLKAGLSKLVIDPVIYSSNNLYYKTIYNPYTIKDNSYIIEFFVSSTEIITTLNDYSEKIYNLKIFSIIAGSAAIIIVIITIIFFSYNFSLLIKNLSGHIKKAVEGSDIINLKSNKDDDLGELADPFTSIVSELISKKDPGSDLFKTGVELLKKENYNDAIAVFKTLTIIKPDSFGSYFNLGVAYVKTKRFIESREMFENALKNNPGHTLVMNYLDKVTKLQDAQKANGKPSSEIKG